MNKNPEKLILGFGVLVVLAGTYFILKEDYIGGISGVLVGALLIYTNMKAIKKTD